VSKKVNRAEQVNLANTKKQVSVGLYEMDAVIKYYFDNVIQPTVKSEDGIIQVPVVYASPEKWNTMQKSGFLRDSSGKLQLPAITYKRTSLERNLIGNKVDVKNPLVQSFQIAYSKKNTYDNFSVLNNRKPIVEYTNVVVPDYIKVSYECVIWTDYIAQLNSIVEDINYASNQYWGNDQFKFLAKIDSFTTDLTAEVGDDRASKATFNIEMNGYVIPNNIQKAMSNFNPKTFSPAMVNVGSELVIDINDLPKK